MTIRLVVITEAESDLLGILYRFVPSLVLLKPGELTSEALHDCDAIAVLGGATDRPIQFRPVERVIMEKHVRKGTRILAEFCTSIGSVFMYPPENTRYERMAYISSNPVIEDVAMGDLLDDQSGLRMKPHAATCSSGVPILQYVKQHAHDHIEVTDSDRSQIADRALWFDQPDNVLICSFRLVNFVRARFSPQGRVQAVVEYVVSWLLGEQVKLGALSHPHETGHYNLNEPLAPQVRRSAGLAMKWFREAGILLDNGKGGVEEGVASEIYHNGEQRMFQWIRSDCIGETAMAYTMDYLLTGERESLDISDSLAGVIFNTMQCKDEGDLHGMIRWTDEQWDVCYQDDVARAIVPEMLKYFFVGHSDYLEECMHALDFLVRTTGTDGTRFYCTFNSLLTPEEMLRLNSMPGDMPSAHFNAYYYAALLLAYKITGKTSYREVAVRGLTTIMAVYPDTFRVLSQTQEYSRLIYPLSWLYWITGDGEHKEWLYRVANDLLQFKHPSGAYLEWDDGYTSMMRRKIGEDENSMLAVNGDCVADLLYTNNWLPFAWMQAYWVTKDPFFLEQWNDTAKFMVSAQLHSGYAKINGGWARAFDPDKMEVFGSPADNSWGPWAIESGWTVAEIASGLMMGLLDERLSPFFSK